MTSRGVRARAGNSAVQEMKHHRHSPPRKSFDKKTKPASPKSAFTPLDSAQPTSHITETKTYPILPQSFAVVKRSDFFLFFCLRSLGMALELAVCLAVERTPHAGNAPKERLYNQGSAPTAGKARAGCRFVGLRVLPVVCSTQPTIRLCKMSIEWPGAGGKKKCSDAARTDNGGL